MPILGALQLPHHLNDGSCTFLCSFVVPASWMVVSTTTSLWLHLHCKRAFGPRLGLLQSDSSSKPHRCYCSGHSQCRSLCECVSCSCVKRAQPARTKASHEAIGAFDLLYLIVFVAAVSVAKAGRAVHSLSTRCVAASAYGRRKVTAVTRPPRSGGLC